MRKAPTFIPSPSPEWPTAAVISIPRTAAFIVTASRSGPITPAPISIANGVTAAARRAITFLRDRRTWARCAWAPILPTSASAHLPKKRTRRRPVQVPPRRRLRMRVHQDLPPRLLPLRPEHSRLPLQNLALQLRLLRRGLLRRQNRHTLPPPHQTPHHPPPPPHPPRRQTPPPAQLQARPRLQPLQHRQVASHFPIQPRG